MNCTFVFNLRYCRLPWMAMQKCAERAKTKENAFSQWKGYRTSLHQNLEHKKGGGGGTQAAFTPAHTPGYSKVSGCHLSGYHWGVDMYWIETFSAFTPVRSFGRIFRGLIAVKTITVLLQRICMPSNSLPRLCVNLRLLW